MLIIATRKLQIENCNNFLSRGDIHRDLSISYVEKGKLICMLGKVGVGSGAILQEQFELQAGLCKEHN